jgi:hypothetical protein
MAQTCSPDPVPVCYQNEVELLSRDLQLCLNMYSVPYSVQANLAKEHYTTVADLACRWDTPEKARELGPKELGFEEDSNGFTKSTSRHTAMRLFQAVNDAKVRYDKNIKGSSGATGPTEDPISLQPGQRAVLEDTYRKRLGLTMGPPLEDQGSDQFLAAQLAFCKKGEVGHFQVKKIISAIPEPDEVPYLTKRRKRDADGYMRELEDEERKNPQTLRQWEGMIRVFQTNLLMCVWAFPQFSQLSIEKEDLDSFYRFLLGPAIAHRTPPPSVMVLMIAERKAWREVVISMHKGVPLRQALKDVQADSLFWQREVYERIHKETPSTFTDSPKRGKGEYRGKGKPFQGWQPIHSPTRPKGKGRKGKFTTKGKGKSSWPSNWASKDPSGKEFCRNHLLTGKCGGQCGRSHRCPVLKGDSWICNGDHSPDKCPHSKSA